MTATPDHLWSGEEQAFLLETSRDFASSRDIDTVLERLSRRILEVVPASRSGILLVEEGEEGEAVVLAARHSDPLRDGEQGSRRLDPALYPELAHLRRTRSPLMVEDVRTHPLMGPVAQRLDPTGLRSLLCVPLLAGDELLGILSIGRLGEPRPFEPRVVELCQTIAHQAATALQNARLYEELRKLNQDLEETVRQRTSRLRHSLRQLAVINEIVHDVALLPQPGERARRAVELLRERFDLYAALIAFHDEEEDRFRIIASCAQEPLAEELAGLEQGLDEGICGWVVTRGTSYLTGDTRRDPHYLPTALRDTRSELCVPLRIGSRVVGVLDIQSDRRNAFTEEDRLTLEVLADTLGTAVRTAELFTHAERARAFTDAVIENLTGGLLVTDHKGIVRRANHRACEILGADRATLEGKHLTENCPGVEALFTYEPAGAPRELVIERPDGRRVPIGYSNAFFASREGSMDAVLISFQDLSEMKALQRQVRHRERLATIGQVASAVAHEVRNPLFGISSTAQVLAQELEEDPSRRELVDVLLEETRRLDRLVEQLLSYGRPVEPELRRDDLVAVWREVLELERGEAAAGEVELHADLPEEAPARFDRDLMKGAFLNLLRNAMEAARGRVEIRLERQGEEVLVEVADDGPGVPEQDRDRVFDLYYTTKGGGGSGIGLALCRKAARDHGGEVACHPREGGGALFRLSIPVEPPSVPEAPAGASTDTKELPCPPVS